MTSTHGSKFAFYGRVSTEDQQDPEASRAWQITRAQALITPHGGAIVVEYFDVGQSRSLPWPRRPRAADLLAKLRDPDRGFGAVVIGEPHRAFYGNQFGLTLPVLTHFGVKLWVPEVGGAIDPDNEAHELVMSVFGGMSKGERNRIKVRVRTAMETQTELEGRFLGGRPPYGYAVVEAGPHPNPAKAAEGRRLHVLAVDEVTAPIVRRIFTEFLAGTGIFAIAEGLTADGVPCPSAYDRRRNSHRSGVAWSKSAVRTILTNPRYTGYQIWNKQRTDEVLLDVDDVALGYTDKMRWNPQAKWVRSRQRAHPAIIDEETFDRAQNLFAAGNRAAARGPGTGRVTRMSFAGRSTAGCMSGECKVNIPMGWPTTGAGFRRSTPWRTGSRTRATSTCARTCSSSRSMTGCSGRWRRTGCRRQSRRWKPVRTTLSARYGPSQPAP